MKFIIIGAGIAGNVAFGAFQSYSPQVFEARPEKTAGLSQHKAVMRIRDPKIGYLLGCNLTKIQVHKMVFFDGQLHSQPSIIFNNLYSLKLYNHLDFKSINELGFVDRYLIREDISCPGIRYNHKLISVKKGELTFEVVGKGEKRIEYDFCISTIPMPVILNSAGISLNKIKFTSNPISVTLLELYTDSYVHQTVYFPEKKFNAYRVTLERSVIIIEGTKEPKEQEIREILRCFGLGLNDIKISRPHHQKVGKMIPIQDDFRRLHIMNLSRNFNIFSLGRFAIWKPIRVDHLVHDLEKIKRLTSISHINRGYQLAKED